MQQIVQHEMYNAAAEFWQKFRTQTKKKQYTHDKISADVRAKLAAAPMQGRPVQFIGQGSRLLDLLLILISGNIISYDFI